MYGVSSREPFMSIAITTQNAACWSVELDCTRSRIREIPTNLFRSHRTLQQTTAHLLQQQTPQPSSQRKTVFGKPNGGDVRTRHSAEPEHRHRKKSESVTTWEAEGATINSGVWPEVYVQGKTSGCGRRMHRG